MKQSKLRRRRVLRYSLIYLSLLVLFLALLVAPIVGGSKVGSSLSGFLPKKGPLAGLLQPIDQTNNDTGSEWVTLTTKAAATTTAAEARLL